MSAPILIAVVVILATVAYFVLNGKKQKLVQLSPKQAQKFKLIEKQILIPAEKGMLTMLFRFGLPQGYALALPTGQHISIKGFDAEGNVVFRQYTPTTNENTIGHFDVVIKIYPNGAMGNYLKNLPLNSDVEIKGPFGSFSYEGNGKVIIKRNNVPKTYDIKNVGMIAGGSGLTPMYQIAQNVSDQKDELKMSLIFGNQTDDDIICRKELDALTARNPNFSVWYTVDRTKDENWKYTVGYMNKDLFQQKLPAPSANTMILLCGPPGLINASKNNLLALGYTEDMMFAF
eukprot:UN00183